MLLSAFICVCCVCCISWCDILYLTTNKVLVLTTLEESPALTVVRKTEPSFWQHSYVFAVFVVFLVRYFVSDGKQSEDISALTTTVNMLELWEKLSQVPDCSLGVFAVFVVFLFVLYFVILYWLYICVSWCNILYLTANKLLVLTTVEDSAAQTTAVWVVRKRRVPGCSLRESQRPAATANCFCPPCNIAMTRDWAAN